MNLKDFQNTKKILEFLHTKPAASRKAVLSALVVLTQLDAFKQAMAEDIGTFNKDMAEQKNSQKQIDALVTPAEIKTVYDRLVVEADACYKKKTKTVSDLLCISDMVILALLGGMFIPPRRALDYCAFKIKEIDPKTCNYLDKSTMYFSVFKTAKTYGTQTVTIPPALKAILTKYIKINSTDWLFFDSKLEPLNSVKLNQKLCKIFNGRRVAINSLRHCYLTNKYTDFSKEEKEMEHDLQQMGSSKNMLNTYVKLE